MSHHPLFLPYSLFTPAVHLCTPSHGILTDLQSSRFGGSAGKARGRKPQALWAECKRHAYLKLHNSSRGLSRKAAFGEITPLSCQDIFQQPRTEVGSTGTHLQSSKYAQWARWQSVPIPQGDGQAFLPTWGFFLLCGSRVIFIYFQSKVWREPEPPQSFTLQLLSCRKLLHSSHSWLDMPAASSSELSCWCIT